MTDKNDEWFTPPSVFEYFRLVWQLEFDYDPCTVLNHPTFQPKSFDTKETNGLHSTWKEHTNIFVNPPFSKKKQFIAKAVREITAKGSTIQNIVILVSGDTLTNNYMEESMNKFRKWTEEWMIKMPSRHDPAMKLVVPKGRINFLNDKGEWGQGATFGSLFIVLQRFALYEPYINFVDIEKKVKEWKETC